MARIHDVSYRASVPVAGAVFDTVEDVGAERSLWRDATVMESRRFVLGASYTDVRIDDRKRIVVELVFVRGPWNEINYALV